MIRLIFLFVFIVLSLSSSAHAAVKKQMKMAAKERVVITILRPALYNVKWKTLRLSKSGEMQPGSIKFENSSGETQTKKVESTVALAIENDTLQMIWDLKYQLPKNKPAKNCQVIAEIHLPVSKERITICQQSLRDFGQSAGLVQKLDRLKPKI
jgi:hypothetical protein